MWAGWEVHTAKGAPGRAKCMDSEVEMGIFLIFLPLFSILFLPAAYPTADRKKKKIKALSSGLVTLRSPEMLKWAGEAN